MPVMKKFPQHFNGVNKTTKKNPQCHILQRFPFLLHETPRGHFDSCECVTNHKLKDCHSRTHIASAFNGGELFRHQFKIYVGSLFVVCKLPIYYNNTQLTYWCRLLIAFIPQHTIRIYLDSASFILPPQKILLSYTDLEANEWNGVVKKPTIRLGIFSFWAEIN